MAVTAALSIAVVASEMLVGFVAFAIGPLLAGLLVAVVVRGRPSALAVAAASPTPLGLGGVGLVVGLYEAENGAGDVAWWVGTALVGLLVGGVVVSAVRACRGVEPG